MEIVYHEEELLHYMKTQSKSIRKDPVLIDRYLTGKEIEVDAVSDGETVVIPGIMEHIERAGVHPETQSLFIRLSLSQRTLRKN